MTQCTCQVFPSSEVTYSNVGVRHYRTGGGSGVTSTVEDLTGRESIAFEQFARDHAALLSQTPRSSSHVV